jgi:nucleotide-binding universal stress UspA family protein
MKKILIAIDYDASADHIAQEGYALAKAMKAQPILLHVTSDGSNFYSTNYSPIMGFGIFSNETMVEKDSAVALRKFAMEFLEETKRKLNDDSIETIVENGESAENIVAVSEELKADMIVMGTHARKGLSKMILGSVAEKVLHHSKVPMLIIPAAEKRA